MVVIVRQSTYDGGSCLHVFSVWNAAFANTHSGLGGTQQIFLVAPATLIKTPPPTPAQLFQVIPQFNYSLTISHARPAVARISARVTETPF